MGTFEHDQLVVAIYPCSGVEKFAAALLHEGFRVMRRVFEPASLQFVAKQLSEIEANGRLRILVGHEHRMAAEAITVFALDPLVIPASRNRAGTES